MTELIASMFFFAEHGNKCFNGQEKIESFGVDDARYFFFLTLPRVKNKNKQDISVK